MSWDDYEEQGELFGWPPPPIPPDGPRGGDTYDPDRDGNRLNRQARAVWGVMADGRWHTLQGIAITIGEPEASISARLRDFRKPRFGSHIVERRYLADGLWEYRLNDPKFADPEPVSEPA